MDITMNIYLTDPDQITAIIPMYRQEGDVSLIVYRDGRTEVKPCQVRAVLCQIARQFCIDLPLIKKKAGAVASRSLYNPLLLNPELLLVPLKTRRPRVPRDNTLAYINSVSVTNISKSNTPPYRTNILLAGGYQLKSLWTLPTIKKHIRTAELVFTNLINDLPWGQPTVPEAAQIKAIAQKLVEVCCTVVGSKTNH